MKNSRVGKLNQNRTLVNYKNNYQMRAWGS